MSAKIGSLAPALRTRPCPPSRDQGSRFPFTNFPVDPKLGPEMKSTGEDGTTRLRFSPKARRQGTSLRSPAPSFCVREEDKPAILTIARSCAIWIYVVQPATPITFSAPRPCGDPGAKIGEGKPTWSISAAQSAFDHQHPIRQGSTPTATPYAGRPWNSTSRITNI